MNKPSKTLKFIMSLLITALIVFPLIGIGYILFPHNNQPRSNSGFDVLHNCPVQPTIWLYLQPITDSQNVRATVKIDNWEDLKKECGTVEIHFPGATANHQAPVNFNSFEELEKLMAEDPQGYTARTRKPLADTSIYRDLLLGEDVIKLMPDQLTTFGGTVELVWLEGLRNTDFEKFNLYLPFRATVREGVKLQNTQKYKVQVLSLKNYDLTSRTPETTSFRSLGDTFFYNFDIDASKTQLSLVFENSKLAAKKDYLLMLFSTLFGIGLGLVLEWIVNLIKSKGIEELEVSSREKTIQSPIKPDRNRPGNKNKRKR